MRDIFDKIAIGDLRLKNRLVRSATWEGVAAPDGGIDEQSYSLYDELAAGGIGAIITGFTSVAANDHYFGGMMRLCDDALVPLQEVGMEDEMEGLKGFKVPTDRGPLLDGVLFCDTPEPADTVLIAITGIHGNFYSNPFYINFGQTLNAGGFDFVYAQTCDAFGQIQTEDWRTGRTVAIGSQTEDFNDTVDDVGAYVRWAERAGYRHIYLAGHSLGANKVIRYLSETHDPRVERFVLLSPANLDHMTSDTTMRERQLVKEYMATGRSEQMLPFALMGWAPCVARTAHQWLFEPILNNAHTEPDGDFSQAGRVTHRGMLLVGTYDNFTRGDPTAFLRTINSHMPTAKQNELVFVPRTGHTYQQREQDVADVLRETVARWREWA